jgi:plasmid stabilization system protein ParE
VSWTLEYNPAIENDLFRIGRWIAEFAGDEVGRRKVAEIDRAVKTLSDAPFGGARRDDAVPGLRVVFVAEKAVIAFVPDAATRTVRVLAITYGGADWRRIVRRRAR